MPLSLKQSFLVIFLAWFFFSSNLLVIFLLPKPQHEAQAGILVEVLGDAWGVVETAIRTAYDTVKAAYLQVSAAIDKWIQKNELLKQALKAAWAYARKKLLNMLVNDIISWIQGGGKPRFLSDFPGALEEVGDQALGKFANELAQGNLCGAFRPTLKGLFPGRRAFFEDQVSCTASQITGNMERIWETNFEQGGWQNWLKVQEPQNNIFGAYFIAQGELADIVARATESKKLQIGTGSGFLGQEECSEWGVLQVNSQSGRLEPSGRTINRSLAGTVSMGSENCTTALEANNQTESYDIDEHDDRGAAGNKALKITCGSQTFFDDSAMLTCQKKQTLTPADTIARSAGKAIGTDIDWLIANQEEFHGYLVAIIDAVVNRVAREGLALVKHDGGSYTRKSEGGARSLKCANLKPEELAVRGDCTESQEGIKPLGQDPVQIVLAERELLPQIQLELKEFLAEMDDIVAKLTKMRDLQQQIEAKERNIAQAAAKIIAAPRIPEDPIVNQSLPDFPLYPPLTPTSPTMPNQPGSCKLGSFAQKTRTPDQASQSGNTMQEIFNLVLQEIAQTIGAASLMHVGGPVASIGSLQTDRVMTYTGTVIGVPPTTCASANQKTETWTSVNPPATRNIQLEISDELEEIQTQINAISGQKALVEGLIRKVGYTVNPPVKNDYREVLDDWYERLGIRSGNVTTDKTLLAQALAEISQHRNGIIADFQTLLNSQEPELPNLTTAFIAFRASVLKKVADIDLKLGSPQFPQNGGYHGKLAEVEKIETAILNAANTCNMAVTRTRCEP